LKCGDGEACAGHNNENAAPSTLTNVDESESDENLGLVFPNGSVIVIQQTHEK
jgi:hypothetical protein